MKCRSDCWCGDLVAGVDARFCPPVEALAFAISEAAERDLPEIRAEPLAVVTEVLERYARYDEVLAHLPDVVLLDRTVSQADGSFAAGRRRRAVDSGPAPSST